MKLLQEQIERTCPESEILNELLSFDNKKILELGCGKAQMTRQIATQGHNRQIVATEVDKIQHQKNVQTTDLPNVKFVYAGSQDLPFDENSFDVILLFKSLHHVPMESMDSALQEIARVLKPGGKAYISEPLFAGEFNELLRLFHDEEQVRKAAFQAVVKSVEQGSLLLEQQVFFNSPRSYQNFADFEKLILKVTHLDFQLSENKMNEVRSQFMQHMGETGAHFVTPIRVDLLSKS